MDASNRSTSAVSETTDRIGLAKYRTQLALDRTTLAWIRTALTMASFGFGMVAFFRSLRESSPSDENARLQEAAIHFGLGLVVLGLTATVLASASHWFTLRRLRLGRSPVLRQWPLSIIVAVMFGIVCVAGLCAILLR
jgi:putative membrane protein